MIDLCMYVCVYLTVCMNLGKFMSNKYMQPITPKCTINEHIRAFVSTYTYPIV